MLVFYINTSKLPLVHVCLVLCYVLVSNLYVSYW